MSAGAGGGARPLLTPGLWRELSGDIFGDGADPQASLTRYREIYALAGELVAARPDDADGPRLRLHCGAVLVSLASDSGALAEARGLFDELLADMARLGDDPVARECVARAAKALIFALGDAEDDGEAAAVYDMLADMARAFPADDAVALEQADAAAGLVLDAARRGDDARIGALLSALGTMAGQHRGDPAFAMALGRGALSHIDDVLARGDRVSAVRLARVYAGIIATDGFAAHIREEMPDEAARVLQTVARLLAPDALPAGDGGDSRPGATGAADGSADRPRSGLTPRRGRAAP
ncbi:MAG: hypothetical protein JNK11_03200 [Alphaproteobacteria bacterium]|nr:hypothetical protein [Alphaproteobacteria bacterium]